MIFPPSTFHLAFIFLKQTRLDVERAMEENKTGLIDFRQELLTFLPSFPLVLLNIKSDDSPIQLHHLWLLRNGSDRNIRVIYYKTFLDNDFL